MARPIYELAAEIRRCWPRPYYGCVPYLAAMAELDTIRDKYIYDDAKTILVYALSNMTTFKGPDARRLKAELKQIAGLK